MQLIRRLIMFATNITQTQSKYGQNSSTLNSSKHYMQICHAEKSKVADDEMTSQLKKKESFANWLFEKSCSKEPICELCI